MWKPEKPWAVAPGLPDCSSTDLDFNPQEEERACPNGGYMGVCELGTDIKGNLLEEGVLDLNSDYRLTM